MLGEKSNIIDIQTGERIPAQGEDGRIPLQKVSFMRHKLAQVWPAFLGEPDLMISKEPGWLTRLKTPSTKKTKTPPLPTKKASSSDQHNHLPMSDEEGLLDRIGHLTGIR